MKKENISDPYLRHAVTDIAYVSGKDTTNDDRNHLLWEFPENYPLTSNLNQHVHLARTMTGILNKTEFLTNSRGEGMEPVIDAAFNIPVQDVATIHKSPEVHSVFKRQAGNIIPLIPTEFTGWYLAILGFLVGIATAFNMGVVPTPTRLLENAFGVPLDSYETKHGEFDDLFGLRDIIQGKELMKKEKDPYFPEELFEK
ncbi:uncharacterized protein LOC136033054 isoform X2 [Artemia franciscana]|uniref:uncharacterized protein LOC136033054 isoform X2 n=1 Tax=Artemia franciscana TaxID=6661 RepID=UPI0032DA8B36